MGFTLKLRFHGSIALVPSADKKKVTMLIGKFKVASGMKELVPHIKFPKDSLQSAERVVHEPPPDSPGDKNLRHILLEDGELLTLKADSGSQLLELDNSTDPFETKPVASTRFSLKWLPHIAEIEPEDPEIGQIHPQLMNMPQQKNAPDRVVSGRMDLARGLLRTTGILEPLLIDFVAKNRPKVTTAVAREAELVLDVAGDSLVIESHSLFDNTPHPAMTFFANGAEELVITIGNEPEDEIHQPIPTIQPDGDNDIEAAEEFRTLYEFSSKKNKIDVTKLRAPRVTGRRPTGSLCVIPVFNSGAGI